MNKLINPSPQLFIVMGVSGSGKSSLAKHMAHAFDLIFIDADDFHSVEAKKYMADNNPLTDEMREPWVESIITHLNLLYRRGESVVLAYSGLKLAHRTLFRGLYFYSHFFYLIGDKSVIENRIVQREDHFFSPALLDSQFEAMEPPLLSEPGVSQININRPFLSVANEMNKLAQQIIRKINDV